MPNSDTTVTPETSHPFPNVILFKMFFPAKDGVWNQNSINLHVTGSDDDKMQNMRDWVLAQNEVRKAARKKAEEEAAAASTENDEVVDEKPEPKKSGGRIDTGTNLMSAHVVMIETRHLLSNLLALGYKLVALSGFIKKDYEKGNDKDVVVLTFKRELDEDDQEILMMDRPTDGGEEESTAIYMANAIINLLLFVEDHDEADEDNPQLGWTSVHVWDNSNVDKDLATINLDGPSLVTGIRPLQLCADSKGLYISTSHELVYNQSGKPTSLTELDEPKCVELPARGLRGYDEKMQQVRDYRTAAGKMVKAARKAAARQDASS